MQKCTKYMYTKYMGMIMVSNNFVLKSVLLMGNDGPHAGTCQQVPSLLPHGEPQRSAGRLRIRSERRPL
jgi:hypothetical protein